MNKPSDPQSADDLLAAYLAEGDSALPDVDEPVPEPEAKPDGGGIDAQLAAYLQGESSLGPSNEETQAAEAHRKRAAGGSTLFGGASPSWKRSVSKAKGRQEGTPAAPPTPQRAPYVKSEPEPGRQHQPAHPALDDDSVLDLGGFTGAGEAWDAEPERPDWLDDDLGGEHFDSAIDLTAGSPLSMAADASADAADATEYGQLEFDPTDSEDLGAFALDAEYAPDDDDDSFGGFEFDEESSRARSSAFGLDDSQPPLAVPGIVRSESAIGARPAAYDETSAFDSDPALDETAAGAFDPAYNVVAPSPFDADASSDIGDGPHRPPSNPGFQSESEFEDLYAADQLDIAPEYISDLDNRAMRQMDRGGEISAVVAEVMEERLQAMERRIARKLGAAETQAVGDLAALATGVNAELAVLPPDWGITAGPSSRNTRTGRKTRVDFFLNLMRRRDSDQLHLHVGYSPLIRVDGELEPMRFRYILAADWDRLIQPICPPGKWPMWLQDGDVEFYYDVDGLGRVHVSLFRERGGAAAVFEMIPADVPSLEALALPNHLERLADLEEGLVLVCGTSGSGVSTTTASLVDAINQRSTRHIVTVEDPIDYVYVPRKSVIHQREVGVHARSFEGAMRAVVRESPDVIVLGAMRTPEVIQLALEAVETGSLVFAVVGTRSTSQALERLVGSFPEDERGPLRQRLGDALRVAMAQQLVVTNTGVKQPALEILLNTLTVAKDIRAGRFDAMTNHLVENRGMGMVSMDQCLFDMWKEDVITQEIAYDRCHDRAYISSLFEAENERVEREHAEAVRAAAVGHDDKTSVPGDGPTRHR
jgi:twitching motility protein PilT